MAKSSIYDGEVDRKLWIRGRSQQTPSNDGSNSPILSAIKMVENNPRKLYLGSLPCTYVDENGWKVRSKHINGYGKAAGRKNKRKVVISKDTNHQQKHRKVEHDGQT